MNRNSASKTLNEFADMTGEKSVPFTNKIELRYYDAHTPALYLDGEAVMIFHEDGVELRHYYNQRRYLTQVLNRYLPYGKTSNGRVVYRGKIYPFEHGMILMQRGGVTLNGMEMVGEE